MPPEDANPPRGSGVIVAGAELLDRAREVSRRIVERVQKVAGDTATNPGNGSETPTEDVSRRR
jgi:hypothetical protein